MNSTLLQAEQVIKRDPAVQNVMGFTEAAARPTPENAFVILKPLNQRGVSATQVINDLRPALSHITGAQMFLQASQDLRIGGRGSNAQYQYTIQADNVADLQTWGPKLLAAMQKLPGFQDVSSDQQNGGLDQLMTYDRVTAARLGQTASSLDSALYSEFGQSEVSLIYTQPEPILCGARGRAAVLGNAGRTEGCVPSPVSEQQYRHRKYSDLYHGESPDQHHSAAAPITPACFRRSRCLSTSPTMSP